MAAEVVHTIRQLNSVPTVSVVVSIIENASSHLKNVSIHVRQYTNPLGSIRNFEISYRRNKMSINLEFLTRQTT